MNPVVCNYSKNITYKLEVCESDPKTSPNPIQSDPIGLGSDSDRIRIKIYASGLDRIGFYGFHVGLDRIGLCWLFSGSNRIHFFTKDLFCKEEIFDLLLICESLHLSGCSISNLNIRLFHHFHPYFSYI